MEGTARERGGVKTICFEHHQGNETCGVGFVWPCHIYKGNPLASPCKDLANTPDTHNKVYEKKVKITKWKMDFVGGKSWRLAFSHLE